LQDNPRGKKSFGKAPSASTFASDLHLSGGRWRKRVKGAASASGNTYTLKRDAISPIRFLGAMTLRGEGWGAVSRQLSQLLDSKGIMASKGRTGVED